jgi:hypothetical protein
LRLEIARVKTLARQIGLLRRARAGKNAILVVQLARDLASVHKSVLRAVFLSFRISENYRIDRAGRGRYFASNDPGEAEFCGRGGQWRRRVRLPAAAGPGPAAGFRDPEQHNPSTRRDGAMISEPAREATGAFR